MPNTEATFPQRLVLDKPPAADASLNVSDIQFYCELDRPGGLIIPLGVMAEIVVPGIRGLGLIARTELHDEETAAVGELGRRLVERPFDFLSKEFDDVWEHAAPGEALRVLSVRHPHSLHFAVPVAKEVPLTLLGGISPAARNAVRNYLGQFLEEEMLRLVARYDLDPDRPKPQRELLSLNIAA
jgi:hypothetical protein